MAEGYMDAAAVPVPDAGEDTWGGIDHSAVKVLVQHQRRDIGSCLCGWGGPGALGQSHAVHVWRQLQAAGVDRRMVLDPGEDTLREAAAAVLVEHRWLTTVWRCACEPRTARHDYSEDTFRRHAEHIADALLPHIREHTAGLALGMQSWRERAEAAEAELERLIDWKESAMTVMSGLQDLGKELGLPLGESITGTLAAETAHQLRTCAERARAVCDAVKYKVPGDPNSYGAYPEGRSDQAGEVLTALDGSETP